MRRHGFPDARGLHGTHAPRPHQAKRQPSARRRGPGYRRFCPESEEEPLCRTIFRMCASNPKRKSPSPSLRSVRALGREPNGFQGFADGLATLARALTAAEQTGDRYPALDLLPEQRRQRTLQALIYRSRRFCISPQNGGSPGHDHCFRRRADAAPGPRGFAGGPLDAAANF
jgi:hypothetical protein